MARIDSPSTLMYAKLKEWGVSNRDAASLLLNTTLTFNGNTLRNRIEESSQLSRRVVHTAPGELPAALFNSFEVTCPQLMRRLVARLAVNRCGGSEERATERLDADLTGPCANDMRRILQDLGIDDSPYRNMQAYLEHASLAREQDRTLLRLMMFVVTGCLGNPRAAATLVVDYATNILGADFHTAQTIVTAAPPHPEEVEAELLLGLVRLVDGHIEAGSQMHMLSPEGTELGLLPRGRHVVTDVAEDVSRRHAYAWREDGRWFLRDLGSTNGTHLVSGADGSERAVGEEPVALEASDIVCLGSSTRFIVMPVIGS